MSLVNNIFLKYNIRLPIFSVEMMSDLYTCFAHVHLQPTIKTKNVIGLISMQDHGHLQDCS
jgi:hypothetical protein